MHQVIGVVHYCTDETGHVNYATLVRASGLPGYDARLVGAVRRWLFQPFNDDGKPVGVCSSVQFIYHQR